MKSRKARVGVETQPEIASLARHSIFATDSGYFPVLIKRGNEAVVLYRDGGGHYGKGGRVAFKKSKDGMEWGEILGAIEGETDYRNPCAGVREDGKIIAAIFVLDVYHGENDTVDMKFGKFRIVIYEIDISDGFRAETLSDVETEQLCSFYGKALNVEGAIIMPFHDMLEATMFRSDDGGYNWERMGSIAPRCYEPAALRVGNEYIVALRGGTDETKYGGVLLTRGDGETWTEPVDITGVYSHPADLIELGDGTILLTYAERHPDSQKIMVKISEDGGHTWSAPVRISNIYREYDFGYPSSVEIEPGKIITVYYSQPGLDRDYSLNDMERYSGKNCVGRSVVYEMEMIRKALEGGGTS